MLSISRLTVIKLYIQLNGEFQLENCLLEGLILVHITYNPFLVYIAQGICRNERQEIGKVGQKRI